MVRLTALVLSLGITAPGLRAQAAGAFSTELPPILPEATEIALARSAAPAEVSGRATVLKLVRGHGFEVAVEGSNGVTCVVNRSWPESLEPHCYDAEASRTVLLVHRLHAEMRERGAEKEDIDRAVAEAIDAGRIPLPSRPAVTWMLSAGQVLYNDSGTRIGAWKPHWMIYFPNLTAEDLDEGGGSPGDGPLLVDPGQPLSNLVFIAPSFVPVEPIGGA